MLITLLTHNFIIVLFNDVHYYYLLGKGGYVFGGVGLSVCGQHYSKSYEWTGMIFLGQGPV